MTVTLRDARSDELDEISALMVDAYAQYAEGLPDYLWEDYAAEIADVRRRLPHSQLIVAEVDGRLAGAVTFYPDATKSDHKGWPEGMTEMRLLAVPPAGRGHKIGRLLAEECIARARAMGAAVIGLHTSHLMHVARDMYERMGFQRDTEHDFIPDPVGTPDLVATAYTMRLD